MSTTATSYRIHCTKLELGPGGTQQEVRRCLEASVEASDPSTLKIELAEIVGQAYPGMQVASYEPIGGVVP